MLKEDASDSLMNMGTHLYWELFTSSWLAKRLALRLNVWQDQRSDTPQDACSREQTDLPQWHDWLSQIEPEPAMKVIYLNDLLWPQAQDGDSAVQAAWSGRDVDEL